MLIVYYYYYYYVIYYYYSFSHINIRVLQSFRYMKRFWLNVFSVLFMSPRLDKLNIPPGGRSTRRVMTAGIKTNNWMLRNVEDIPGYLRFDISKWLLKSLLVVRRWNYAVSWGANTVNMAGMADIQCASAKCKSKTTQTVKCGFHKNNIAIKFYWNRLHSVAHLMLKWKCKLIAFQKVNTMS